MIETGSNNVREADSGRRARNWQLYRHIVSDFPFTTPETIEAKLQEERETLIQSNNEWRQSHPDWDVYDDKHFGYFASIALAGRSCGATSFAAYTNFHLKAIREAEPIEVISGKIALKVNFWQEKAIQAEGKEIKPLTMITNTPDLLKAIDKWKALYGTRFGFEMFTPA
jgi:hypothetical protein